MIVWNVTDRWFATKAEADKLRKQLKLSPAVTQRADIRNREELARLLDGQVTLPELHRVRPAKPDPRQTDLFGKPEEDPAADTKAGLAAINLAGFPPPGDPAYADEEPPPDGHLETFETEPDDPPHDPETGEIYEGAEPIAADRGRSF